ncbi:MAG: TipAS antibiotic-recognition domain-containing protein, partial [Bacillota bacterium]|nr:TipAS antibiotic-recognition domain-containing protein [Bacillota bacterium]
GAEAQALVKKLRDYISSNYYACTNEILSGLGQMYAAGGEFTENIDAAAGAGTAVFVSKAIETFCLTK